MQPKIIVFGNEKGGTGKSTLAMHLAIFLLQQKKQVGLIDIDARQGTVSRYCMNRRSYQAHLPQPLCLAIHSNHITRISDHNEELSITNDNIPTAEQLVQYALSQMQHCDFIIIDTPGNDTELSRIAHTYADILLTPVNESMIDIDLLAQNNAGQLTPSIYAEMVWKQRMIRASQRKAPIQWFVVRNRMTSLQSNNRQEVLKVLQELSKRLSFSLCEGFFERVVFRELFNAGLTIIDHHQPTKNLSHIAAKKEIQQLAQEMMLI